jgi:hypothetical protein
MVELKFKLTTDVKSSYFGVLDISDWSTDTRSNWGLALFIKDVGDANATLVSLVDQVEWDLSLWKEGDIQIYIFQIPVWIAQSYGAGDVVFYGGNFYYTVSGANAGQVPGTASQWTLAISGSEGVFLNRYSNTSYCKKYFRLNNLIPEGKLSLKKIGDHKFEIKTLDSVENQEYVLYDYKGTLIETGNFEIDSLEIEFPNDGVFYIEIVEEGVTYLESIYDFTDTDNHVLDIMSEIACSEDNCEDTSPENERRMKTLNLIISLYVMIERLCILEKYKYAGIEVIDNTRYTYINDVGRLLQKLRLVLKRI